MGVGIIDGSFEAGINRMQPRHIATQLPFPPGPQHAAHLAVDTGFGALIAPTPFELFAKVLEGAKQHVAIGFGFDGEFNLAHHPFELREEISHGVGITPDVGTATGATAGVIKATFPAVERTIGQPKTGG